MPANPSAGGGPISDLQARLEAERAGRPFLLFRDRDDRQRLYFLAPGSGSISVGRGPSSDLVLDWDDQISRLHALFEEDEDGWELVDDGLSRNGSFVNKQRLSGRRRLRDGDTLVFGTTVVEFHGPDRRPPSRAGADAPVTVVLSSTQRRILIALCRPCRSESGVASPATDEEIAEELVLSVGEVRAHLRVLDAKLGVQERSERAARARLVERAFSAGVISERDL